MVDRKAVLTNLKNFYEWNFKNYPLNFDEAQVIIEALEQPNVVRCKDCGHTNCQFHQCICDEDEYNPEYFCADGFMEDGE